MIARSRLTLLLLALAAVLLVAACGGKGDPNASPVATSSVTMQESEFKPSHVSVATGATVTWRNDDGYDHDVAFEGGPKSAALGGGGTYERTFDEAGVFNYECTLHPGMRARVTVTDS